MFTFKQKILLGFLAIFIGIILLIVPFVHSMVMKIAKKAMEERAIELVSRIEHAKNDDALVTTLKHQKPLIFFRVGIISDKRKVLYDSHVKRVLGDDFSQEYVVMHPEVEEAFQQGFGYEEGHSEILDQDFAYFAKRFQFKGKPYVLRIAFPLEYVQKLSNDFQLGLIAAISLVLLLYSLLTWFTIDYLTKPILQIISSVKPYEEGKVAMLPIPNKETLERSDEFGALGRTLNALSTKIQSQINSITEERNEKAQVLESLNEGVIAVDTDLKIIFANPRAHFFLNQSDALTGRLYIEVNEPKGYALLKKCLEEDKLFTDSIRVKVGKETLFLDLIAAPKTEGAVLVLQDKSPHYKMIEMRKDFIANASHELKTPITIIQGFAEALHDHPSLAEEKKQEMTQKIVSNCGRMTSLIQDLLTLADLERLRETKLDKFELKELVQLAEESIQTLYKQAAITNHFTDEDCLVLADASLLELAISNLLENACKYSENAPVVDVTLKVSGDKVVLSIQDQGVGIPEEDLPHVFERFYRVDKARSRKMGGSGLGLSIVQTIIERHYGTIAATSQVGKGSCFTVTLPK